MRNNIALALAAAAAVCCYASSVGEAFTAYSPDRKDQNENRSIAIFEASVNPRLPSVLILGDSISISYTLPVRRKLEGTANVIRPVANCESTLKFLANLDGWLGQTKWAVIHFNAGLHDLAHVQEEGIAPGKQFLVPVEEGPRWVSVEAYRSNLKKIVERLKQTGARLIFATTTPVPAGARGRLPEDVARYNEAALAVMREADVEIDDLYSVAAKNAYLFQRPHDVHFYQEGSEILAEQVAASIRAPLGNWLDNSKAPFNSWLF